MPNLTPVQPGDLITAQLVNEMISEIETLADRIQNLEERVRQLEQQETSPTPIVTPTSPTPTQTTPTFSTPIGTQTSPMPTQTTPTFSTPIGTTPTATTGPGAGTPTLPMAVPTATPTEVRPTGTVPTGTVMELEGIGREQADKLAEAGLVTLNALGAESPKRVQDVLGVESDEAERIVKEAYALAGGQTGHPLTEVADIGAEKAAHLRSAGIQDLEALSAADTETVKKALSVDEDQAQSLISKAKNILG